MGWSLYIYGREENKRILLAELGRSSAAYRILDEDDFILQGTWDKYKQIDINNIERIVDNLEKDILKYRLDTPYPLTNQDREQTEWFEEYNELVEAYGYLKAVFHICTSFVEYGKTQVAVNEPLYYDEREFNKSDRTIEFYVG